MKNIIFLLFLIPSVSNATLPIGQRATIDSVTYHLFTLDEYKQLLIMNFNLKSFESELSFCQDSNSLNNKYISKLYGKLDSKDIVIETLTKERDRLTTKWVEENRLRHVAENKPKWGSLISWGIAGVTTVVAVVLAGVIVVRK